jgi:A/G-specific adenine glycosylase
VEIRTKLRDWYRSNKRTLPWREISDPYRIWISEIILQQTRVNQGIDYYHRFLEAFPDIETLALATEQEVLKVWEGLGYYTRARNMHAAAKYINHDLKGKFPDSYDEIIQLRGVGPYTAAAVSSMAFREPRAVVDGNVHRVLSRLFGIEELPGQYQASSGILSKASSLLDPDDPGTHNQALMELGALICKPAGPDCTSCPLHQDCFAFKNNRTESLPLKPGKISRRTRYFHYLFIRDSSGIWLRRRSGKDIWEGLYEFPLIETSRRYSVRALMATDDWKAMFGDSVKILQISPLIKHVLSHQDIQARIYHINEPGFLDQKEYTRVNPDQLTRYPLPKLILNYLDKFSN